MNVDKEPVNIYTKLNVIEEQSKKMSEEDSKYTGGRLRESSQKLSALNLDYMKRTPQNSRPGSQEK